MSPASLGLKSRGFAAYMATQGVSALSDNAYKFLLLSYIQARSRQADSSFTGDSALAQALFALPFIVCAPWAGIFADRIRKSTLLVVAMGSELLLMAGTAPAFLADSTTALLVLLTLSAVQSAFFGPAKYGFLPETLEERDLSRANGLVNMTTFVAIIVGQLIGGVLYDQLAPDLWRSVFVLGGIAGVGVLTSLGVTRTPPGQPALSFRTALRSLADTGRETLRHRGLLYTMLGIGHFYMVAAMLQIMLMDYGNQVLGLEATGQSVLVAVSLAGIAAGSLLAARWSERRVELGLVPMGALGLSLGLALLALVPGRPAPDAAALELAAAWGPVASCVAFLGLAGGLFSVPLNANLQVLAPEGAKGRFLAFGNMVSFVGILLAAGGLHVLGGMLQLSAREQALAVAAFTLVGTVVSLLLLPEAFLRLCAWLLAHSFYRIRVLHAERIPEQGGALLVANHVSWVDWLILSVITRRRIHFLIQRQYYEWKPIHWLLKLGGCIPVASGDAPEVVAESLGRAGEQLEQGHLVGIFAEGTITRTGQMQTIRRGYQRILSGRGIPVVPIYLDGLWGSLFSHEGGRFLRRFPKHIPYPVTVVVGEPLPSRAEPWHLRAALQRLSAEAWDDRRATRRPLHQALLRHARRSGRAALLEPGRRPLSRAAVLARALALRDLVVGELGDASRVGLLLPHGGDECIALLAIQYAGLVPVPLGTEGSASELDEALARAGVQVVLTGPELAGRLPSRVRTLDVAALLRPEGARHRRLRREARLWRLVGWVLPGFAAEWLALRGPARRLEDEAVLLFSAGSTGRPKAVALSHHNVRCNVEAVRELLPRHDDDVFVSLLPLSLATGFAHGLWLPLLGESRVVALPDPLDARAVGRAVAREGGTVLLATPRLLELYLRGVKPDHFGSLRMVFAFGEPLRPALRLAFEARFGLRPLEALSSTECGGFVTLSTPDVREAGIFHRGARPGSVGHPLPGLALEVVDPRSGELRAAGEPGELRVLGPAVSRGYLDDPALDARAFRAGWFVSGDEGFEDEDGFVTVTGRFARASMVDGQRLSHAALEDAVSAQLGTPDTPLAIVEAPDGAGGARLAVCYVRGALQPAQVVAGLRAAGLREPWLPRESDFVELPALPLLPTGTVDFRALHRAVAGRT